jgi:hypothetical protein
VASHRSVAALVGLVVLAGCGGSSEPSASDMPKGWENRDAPWALMGTTRGGRDLVVFPLTRRAECATLRSSAVPRPADGEQVIDVRVVVDDSKCSYTKGPDGSVGLLETTPPEPISVPLRATLHGETVTGKDKVLSRRRFAPAVADLRGLSTADARAVVRMYRSRVVIHGPKGAGTYVLRQSPPPADGAGPRGGYAIWTTRD